MEKKWENMALFFFFFSWRTTFFPWPIPNPIYIFEPAPNILSFWFYLAKIQWGIIFMGEYRGKGERGNGMRVGELERGKKRGDDLKNSMTSCLTSYCGHSHQQRCARLKMAIVHNPFCVINTTDCLQSLPHTCLAFLTVATHNSPGWHPGLVDLNMLKNTRLYSENV